MSCLSDPPSIAPASLPRARQAGAATSEPFVLGYRPELDGLRALSLLLIFVAHLAYLWPSVGKRLLPGSFEAVDLFFILSGFLLTTLLLQERHRTGGFSFRNFYQRRALRLLPGLFFVLACNALYVELNGGSPRTLLEPYVVIVTYVGNWATVFVAPNALTYAWDHTWTLAVEEQYYLLFFPLLIVLLRATRSLRKVLVILAAAVPLVWIWRAWVAHNTLAPHFHSVYVRTDTRLDALLLGPIAAIALQLGLRITPRLVALGWVGAAYLVWMLFSAHLADRWVYQWDFAGVDLAWTLVLLAVLGGTGLVTRFFRLRPMVWIGKLSYGLYLWHLPVFVAVHQHLTGVLPPVQVVVALAITFSGASISYYFVERPFLRLKRRSSALASPVEPPRAPAPEPVAQALENPGA